MLIQQDVLANNYPLFSAYINKHTSLGFDELYLSFSFEYRGSDKRFYGQHFYNITIKRKGDQLNVEFEAEKDEYAFRGVTKHMLNSFLSHWKSPASLDLPGTRGVLNVLRSLGVQGIGMSLHLIPEKDSNKYPKRLYHTGLNADLEELNEKFLGAAPFELILVLPEINNLLDVAVREINNERSRQKASRF